METEKLFAVAGSHSQGAITCSQHDCRMLRNQTGLQWNSWDYHQSRCMITKSPITNSDGHPLFFFKKKCCIFQMTTSPQNPMEAPYFKYRNSRGTVVLRVHSWHRQGWWPMSEVTDGGRTFNAHWRRPNSFSTGGISCIQCACAYSLCRDVCHYCKKCNFCNQNKI